jgi:HlyD family secretion protein
LEAQRKSLDEQIVSAEARVSLARTELDRTTVYAPQAGTVLVRAVEAGEVVQVGQPLALLVDLSRLELKVYLALDALGKIRLGDQARVRVDAFPDELFDAAVARVDDYAQFTPRDIHVPDERTQMVYGVTLALDNTERRLKPGMPADAWIRFDDVPWPERLPIPGN